MGWRLRGVGRRGAGRRDDRGAAWRPPCWPPTTRGSTGWRTGRSRTSTACASPTAPGPTTCSWPPARRGSTRCSAGTRSSRRGCCCPWTARSPRARSARSRPGRASAVDEETAEQPGKILHEVRRTDLRLDLEGGFHLPPVYYGTIDATPLWVNLLHDTWRAGMPDERGRRAAGQPRGGAGLAGRPRRLRRGRLPRVPRHQRSRPVQPGLEGLRGLDPLARRLASPRGRSPCARCRATPTRRRVNGAALLDAFGRRRRRPRGAPGRAT